MNPRVLNVVLVVQALFIGALLYAGYCSREARKVGYLELTHRVTSGQATVDDFEKLALFLPETADKLVVRSLFGLPVGRANSVTLKDASKLEGDMWIYYPLAKPASPETPPEPIDIPDGANLSGDVKCLVVQFDKRGRATWKIAEVIHPILPTPSSVTPKPNK